MKTPLLLVAGWLIAVVLFVLSGCGPEPRPPMPEIETDRKPVIVGELDWVEADTLTGPLADVARSVGILPIPETEYRCNAVLVRPDMVMTNNHCIGSSWEAYGVKVGFAFNGTDADWFDCSEFVYTWPENREDMTLLRCKAKNGVLPGDKYGVAVAGVDPPVGSKVFMIHHNCDYLREPGCLPTKKMSPGVVTKLYSPGYYELTYSLDSLPFSSGSPVFDQNGRIVALHHRGLPSPYGTNGDGYGPANAGIRINALVKAVQ